VASQGSFDDRCGVEALDALGGVDLLPEAAPELLVLGVVGPNDLHRERPATRAEGEVHPPHAARAEPCA
jgi:hypothetical protein